MTPQVDVLMPVYNSAEFLAEAIESVLNQSFKDLRLLILDDGSSDDSWKIIQRYVSIDSRVVATKMENQGTLKARDWLVKNSSAEFISWVDSDDVILTTRLEKHLHFLRLNPQFSAVSSDKGYFDKTPPRITPRDPEEAKIRSLFEWVAKDPGTLKREVHDKYNLWFSDCGLDSAEDTWFWSEYLKHELLGTVPEVLYLYRMHASQESSRNIARQQKAHGEVIRRQLARFGIEPHEIEDKTALYPNRRSCYTQDSVKIAGSIYQEILKKNLSLRIFNQEKLDTYLSNNYRGLCRRLGPIGVIKYLQVMGLQRLLRGYNFGLTFILDCFLRTK